MTLPAALLEWSADEASGDVLDASGNGRTAVVSTGNFLARVAGKNGSGLQQTTTATTLGSAITGLQTAARTVSLNLRVNSGFTGWILEFKAGDVLSGSGSWGILSLSGSIKWRAKNAAGSPTDVVFPTDAGNWHNITVTHDGTNLKLYRDGVLAGTVPLAGAIQTADHFLMFDQVGAAATIDDVRMYGVALTPEQVAEVAATPVGAAPAANEGTLDGSFSSPTASMAANGSAAGALAGAFSSPTVTATVTATAEVTVEGTFAAPVTVFSVRSVTNAELAGTFAAPVLSGAGGSVAPEGGQLDGSFTQPTVDMSGRASVDVSMIGTFAQPVFAGHGGLVIPDRDILVTIGPGERPSTSIAAGPSRISVAAGDFKRTEIGA